MAPFQPVKGPDGGAIEGSPTETAFKETIRGENLELSCDFDFTYPKECFRSRKISLTGSEIYMI